MFELSILIPARNEEWLARTITDILQHSEGATEVIAGLDGAWAEPPIADHPRVTLLHTSESIGQRAMTNQLCRLSSAKYVMKADAHCAFDQGFDTKLLADMQDDWTVAPLMRNLHVFNWVCPHGHTRYQGPSGPCTECGEPTHKDVVWIPKERPRSTAYCFDSEPHFQYFMKYNRRPEGKGDITESMSLQGSCFLLTRAKYWELDICAEELGSWGSQGIEVACKTWLSGGRVMINHKTWYAHLFRTQGGDFGFPYPLSGKQVEQAKGSVRELFYANRWPQQTRPLAWLIEHFKPVPGWHDDAGAATLAVVEQAGREFAAAQQQPTQPLSKGVLYYSDNQINMRLARACRQTIAAAGLPITSVTLKPTQFGRNLVVAAERSYKTMFRQILTGLEAMNEDIVFFAEHDVLYHHDHFDFTPARADRFYYNGNYWQVRVADGFAVHYDLSPLSGLVAMRVPLITHFRERLAMIEKQGFGYYMGFEPFTHRRVKWDFWCDFEVFQPEHPNIDLAHAGNLTHKRFKTDRFIRKPKFWIEGDAASIPGWPGLETTIQAFR